MFNPLPAQAFVPVPPSTLDAIQDLSELFENLCEWINVAVTDYESETQLWKVLTMDGSRRTVYLPRIYIMFKAEDPELFALRIKSAVDMRKFTESKLR